MVAEDELQPPNGEGVLFSHQRTSHASLHHLKGHVMWILVVVLLGATAGFAGLWLDIRSANMLLQEQHARASAWAAWRINSLQVDNHLLSQACDRWAQFDRAQVRKISDQARQIHDLTTELDDLKIAHAKSVLGGVEISDEQQQLIDARVIGLQSHGFCSCSDCKRKDHL